MIKISDYNDWEDEDLEQVDESEQERSSNQEVDDVVNKIKNKAKDRIQEKLEDSSSKKDRSQASSRRSSAREEAKKPSKESPVKEPTRSNAARNSAVRNSAATGEGAAGGSAAAGGTAAGGSAAGGAAAGGSAAGGAAAGGSAAGGAAAGGAAAGGAAAGGTAAGGAAAGGAAVATAGAPVIIIILGILLLIIMIFAGYAFINSMPAMFLSQIKETAKEATKTILGNAAGLVTGDYVFITDDETRDLAQYLENMGYNCQGYGYADIKYTDDSKVTAEGKTKTVETVTGVAYKDNNIKSYLAANEETYMLAKNSIWGNLRADWKMISDAIKRAFNAGKTVEESSFDPASYSTGLINVRGESGGFLGFFTTPNEDYVEIDRASEQLITYSHAVEIPFLPSFIRPVIPAFKFGAKFSYDLSDWTSKYGRPTEMFIALHNATMMPDLVYKIANDDDFNTKVNINLQSVTVEFGDVNVIIGDDVNNPDHEYTKKEIEKKYLDYVISKLEGIINSAKQKEKEAADKGETYSWSLSELNAVKLLPKVQALRGNEEKTHEFLMLLMKNDGRISSSDCANYLGVSLSFSVGEGTVSISPLSGDEGSGLAGISKTQLQDLMNLLYTGYKGMNDVKIPYIESVTKHWYYKDIIFTEGTYGVYHRANKVHKTIDYNGGDNSLENFKIKLDATLSSSDGVLYQVNEPLVVGPNDSIINVFNQKYYRYNGGTISAAHDIAKAKLFDSGKSAGYRYIFNGDVKVLVDSYENGKPEKEYPTFGTPGDTLTAFSILREVHTPQSEAVYRMLKELVTSEKITGHFDKDALDEQLTKVLLWPFKDNSKGTKEWDVKKDENEYGIVINNLTNGEDFLAPGDGKVLSRDGNKTTIQFSVLAEGGKTSTVEILKKKYEDDFYYVDKNVVSGMTMTIEGANITSSGTITRGEKIGTVSGDTVKIVMQHKDKSLVGQASGGTEKDTTDDDVENYMDDSYTNYDEQKVIDSILNKHDTATGGERIGDDDKPKPGDPIDDDGDYSEPVDDEELLEIYAIVAAEDSGAAGAEGPWAVTTCAKNRALKNHGNYGTTVLEQLKAPGQFDGYRGGNNPNYRRYMANPGLIPQAVRDGVDELIKGGRRNHNFLYFNATKDGAITQANKYHIPINPDDPNSLRKIGGNWYYGPDDSLGGLGPGTGSENSTFLNYALQVHKSWREAGYRYQSPYDCSDYVSEVLRRYLNERDDWTSRSMPAFLASKGYRLAWSGKTTNALDMGLGSATAIVFKGNASGRIGHVQIYAGQTSGGVCRWYNWGSNSSAAPTRNTTNGDDTVYNTSNGGSNPYFLYAYIIT